MSAAAIEFRDVSLRYRVLREKGVATLKEWAIRRMTSRVAYQEMSALSHVTFSVNPGSTFGIIGPNGAGKSTLLRVAGGILAPSDGEAIIRGSLAPIIELGTGFEFELSGRENILFSGALLGRSRAEMEARFEGIVEFSGLADFIDAPLRTYSTGMVARLAFAVAISVEPHILLLDEIMSVGDQDFRYKCLDRIDEFREAGVTILLVSHDLVTINELCEEAMWLDNGTVRAIGPAKQVVHEYHTEVIARSPAAPAETEGDATDSAALTASARKKLVPEEPGKGVKET